MLQKIPTEISRCQRIQQLIREPFKPYRGVQGLFANHQLQFHDRYEQMNSPANRVIGESCPNLSKMNYRTDLADPRRQGRDCSLFFSARIRQICGSFFPFVSPFSSRERPGWSTSHWSSSK
jgi:hypothetical protein